MARCFREARFFVARTGVPFRCARVLLRQLDHLDAIVRGQLRCNAIDRTIGTGQDVNFANHF